MADRTFKFHEDWKNVIQGLPDDIRLEVYDCMVRYAFGETVEGLKPMASIAFNFIKPAIDADIQNYKAICERNRRNIAKRYEKTQVDNGNLPVVTSGYQSLPVVDLVDFKENKETKEKVIQKEIKEIKEIKENPSKEGEKKNKFSFASNNPIEERIKDFIAKVMPYTERYGQQIIDDFISYWTEHGPNDRLFRKEKETSFDIGRRLGMWARNNSRWQGKPIVDMTKYPIDWQKVMNWYNSLGLVPIKSISELTDERKMAYISVFDVYNDTNEFKNALVEIKKMINVSYHLKGGNKDNWRADFMWLFKIENFMNVKNGKYKDKV